MAACLSARRCPTTSSITLRCASSLSRWSATDNTATPGLSRRRQSDRRAMNVPGARNRVDAAVSAGPDPPELLEHGSIVAPPRGVLAIHAMAEAATGAVVRPRPRGPAPVPGGRSPSHESERRSRWLVGRDSSSAQGAVSISVPGRDSGRARGASALTSPRSSTFCPQCRFNFFTMEGNPPCEDPPRVPLRWNRSSTWTS